MNGNNKSIKTGLILFVLFLTLPQDANLCVLPAEQMRVEHMQLLNVWRDDVLRTGDRSLIEIDGKRYPKSLQNACMKCHTSKKEFCDQCHINTSVTLSCWDCHLSPIE
ncbi:MAG: sulfate reduction electron transfer complex DsrMKJOP subunit DsrJ [Proteobacteria bacterium]|nr:sulfate reduction electron transfer complex DsrMKJOP subunit DsrJ [Pseudomonadota bacterium]MBU1060097.1 sulfate reduction electron transfer complex DsrMKJOP subunit DsrJ [Pseudomonadota bacterium]